MVTLFTAVQVMFITPRANTEGVEEKTDTPRLYLPGTLTGDLYWALLDSMGGVTIMIGALHGHPPMSLAPSSMIAVDNKELVRKIFAGLAHGNPHLFVECMSENFRWRISGSSRWSRTFEGKQAVLHELFGLLRSKIVDRPRMIAEHLFADGDVVVVEARGDNISKTGAKYDNSYCFVVRLHKGKLLEITEYCDTDLALRALGAPDI